MYRALSIISMYIFICLNLCPTYQYVHQGKKNNNKNVDIKSSVHNAFLE